MFIMNHGAEAATAVLPYACRDLLTGRELAGRVALAPREVLIVEKI